MSVAQQTKTKVLLIEDDEADLFLVQEILARYAEHSNMGSYELDHAANLSDGIAKLQSGAPQVILLDLTLPDSHGLESLQKIRSLHPDIPVVILSNTADERVSVEAVRNGAQDFLVKGQVEAMRLSRIMRFAMARRELRNGEGAKSSPGGARPLPDPLLTAALNGLPDRIVLLDAAARFSFANAAAEAAYRFQVSENGGTPPSDPFCACEQDIFEKSAPTVSIALEQADGSRAPVEFRVSVVRDGAGACLGAVLTAAS
jgi:CheY-like chemotaxis protein